MTFRYENEGTTMADSLPEAILRLVNRDLGWDTLDFDAPIDIEIALDSDD